jgi:hypothetical protein
MTLEELFTGERQAVSNREGLAWRAFYVWREAERELTEKAARQGNG